MEQLAKNGWFIETNGAKNPLGLSVRRIRSFKVACRGCLYQAPQQIFHRKEKNIEQRLCELFEREEIMARQRSRAETGSERGIGTQNFFMQEHLPAEEITK